jgi:hypothetical protein
MNVRMPVLLSLAAALALPTAATAATPSSGKVSPTAKTVSWSGDINDPLGVFDLAAFYYGSTNVRGNETCTPPVCDTFTLDVANGGYGLLLKVDAPQSDNVSVEAVDPSGAAQNFNDVEYTTTRTIDLPADPGKWTIKTYGTGAFTYKSSVTMSTTAAASRTAARKAAAKRRARR